MNNPLNPYEEEAREKYGDAAVDRSNERIKNWTPTDYTRAEVEREDIINQIVYNLDCGADSSEVQKQIERYRQHINRFYDCTPEIFRGLGDLYVKDKRFARFFLKYHPELPEFLQEAISYYCDQLITTENE